jgi:heavy metal translocating P-type ATPase
MNQTHTYNIEGMHCASCVSLIQNKIKKLEGIERCDVSLASGKAKITFTGEALSTEALNMTVKLFGYVLKDTELVPGAKKSDGHDHGEKHNTGTDTMAEMKFVIPMIFFSFIMMGWEVLQSNNLVPHMSETLYGFAHHLMPIFASFVLFGIGRKYIRALSIFFKTGTANMDTLVGISTIVAFIYSFVITAFEKSLAPYIDITSNFYDVVIVVIGLIALAQSLEERARRKTNEALQKLAELASKFAIVERNGKEVEVQIEQIVVGDIVVIKPNERVPIDGLVVSGGSSIDESNLTGESIPNDKKEGDTVFAGTQNFQGMLRVRVLKDSKDTALSHIMTIVENAQNSKAPIERIADTISGIFVYVVIVIAFLTFGSWIMFAPATLGFAKAFALALSSTMAVLVIACPCSLGLATPTAIITGVGVGARRGILIKNAESLEKLAKVSAIVFDKTGTLTENKLSIEGIFCPDVHHVCDDTDTAFKRSLAYSLTKASRHPISHSVATWLAEANTKALEVTNLTESAGKGVTATYESVTYYLGSLSYAVEVTKLSEEKIRTIFLDSRFESGRALYLFTDKEILSLIKIHDTIKVIAKQEIAKLKRLGLTVIMATGDHQTTGESVGKKLGIDTVYTNVKPEGKLEIIKELQLKGLTVAMIGDGVNDSPALTRADVAISMSDGSDIAIESSDIVLLNGDIAKVAEAINLAKKTHTTIWQNLIWSFAYNAVGIPVAAGILFPFFGWMLSPAIAGAIMAFESITVVSNSLRLKTKKL